jgi:hypothetical protein
MDKILDIIKEKLESPILTNFFIGILLFNKKVVFVLLSTSFNDKSVNNFYTYRDKTVGSKIELLEVVHCYESNFGLDPWWNLFMLPLFYAILITAGLPYVKSLLNVLHENAEKIYKYLNKRFNDIQIRTEKEYRDLENNFNSVLNEKDKLRTELINTYSVKSQLEENENKLNDKIYSLEQDKGFLQRDEHDIQISLENLQKEFDTLFDKYTFREKTVSELFEGIWKAEWKFDKPTQHVDGFEFFKIVNGNELHTSDSGADGNYKLRCYIKDYKYIKIKHYRSDNEDRKDVIHFKKEMVIVGTNEINKNEFADCAYEIENEKSIRGVEFYYDFKLKGENSEPDTVNIVFSKVS